MSTSDESDIRRADEYPKHVQRPNDKPMYCCCSAILGALAFIMVPTMISNHHFVLEKVCQSNVRQSSLAALQYSEDYDEHLPPASQWITRIMPYLKSEDTLHCPEATDRSHPPACGYAFDSRLSCAALSSISARVNSALIYESLDLRHNASDSCASLPDLDHRRHSTDTVSSCDGHVRGLWRPEDIAKLREDPFAPRNDGDAKSTGQSKNVIE